MPSTAQVVRVSVGRPLAPLAVDAGHEHVLMVVTDAHGVAGEVLLNAREALSVDDQVAAIERELGDALWRRAAAAAFERATRGSRSDQVAAASAAELIALLDDDCVADPTWLDDLDRAFADPLVAAVVPYVGPLALDTDAQFRAWQRQRTPGPLERRVVDVFSAGPLPRLDGAALVIRREALETGLLEATTDEWLRAGWRIEFDPRRIVWRRYPTQDAEDKPVAARVAPPAPDPFARQVRVVDPADPPLSVAIASYNRREALAEVLEGLARQSYPSERFEVVVVLDGSTDGSAELVRALQVPYSLRLVEQDNQGVAATRNRGAREATNPIVVFFDDDTIPAHDFLAEHAASHRRAAAEHVALSYCPPEIAGRDLWSLSVRAWWEDHYRRKATPDHVWTFLDVADAMSSAPRELFLSSGGFDTDFRGRKQDWEWGIRLLERGGRIAYYPRARGVHRLDTRLATALRNSREEGRNDVQLATKHPHVKSRLLLARFAPEPGGRIGGRRRLALDHPSATERAAHTARALLAALERTGRAGAWWKLVNLLRSQAYLAGVGDALGSRERVEEFLAEASRPESVQTLAVDLAEEGPLSTAHTNIALELQLRWRGEPLAGIAALEPGEQWDWDALTERAAEAATGPLKAALGPSLAGISQLGAHWR